MFKYLLKGLKAGVAVTLLNNYRRRSLQLLKIEAAKCYLRGVQMARLATGGLTRIGFVIALIGVGVLLLHVGLFVLLPGTVEAKAVLGMFLGLVYVVIGGVALRATMDERTWMEKSGAADMLKEATRQSKK